MEILNDVGLSPFTTFKVGGKADYFCYVKNLTEISYALDFAKNRNLPIFILGEGSNVLIADDGFRGLVIKPELRGYYFKEEKNNKILAHAQASLSWDNFVDVSVNAGLYGLENLSGIPGSLGATPIQNVGAYGSEVADTIDHVRTFDLKKQILKTFTREECAFRYRDSLFKSDEGRDFLIMSVAFKLRISSELNLKYKDVTKYFDETKEEKNLRNMRKAILKIRSTKFPNLDMVGTAGSFFKNPVVPREKFKQIQKKFYGVPGFEVSEGIKIPAAWLIEHVAHFRGVRHGDVGSFERQALVIVNFGNARASEIKKFGDKIRALIRAGTGIILEHEVQFVG